MADKKKKDIEEIKSQEESDVQEVIINKSKKDIRDHDQYKITPNFTI